MYLIINKCVTAVKFSNFSGHYLRNRSTLDIGVLGYIGIVQHKEHSPEILSIPPGTPCIYINRERAIYSLVTARVTTDMLLETWVRLWVCSILFPEFLGTPCARHHIVRANYFVRYCDLIKKSVVLCQPVQTKLSNVHFHITALSAVLKYQLPLDNQRSSPASLKPELSFRSQWPAIGHYLQPRRHKLSSFYLLHDLH